jgi:hypothetical protein
MRGDRPRAGRLLLAQTSYSLKATLRNPMGAFFTLVFPLMFLGA